MNEQQSVERKEKIKKRKGEGEMINLDATYKREREKEMQSLRKSKTEPLDIQNSIEEAHQIMKSIELKNFHMLDKKKKNLANNGISSQHRFEIEKIFSRENEQTQLKHVISPQSIQIQQQRIRNTFKSFDVESPFDIGTNKTPSNKLPTQKIFQLRKESPSNSHQSLKFNHHHVVRKQPKTNENTLFLTTPTIHQHPVKKLTILSKDDGSGRHLTDFCSPMTTDSVSESLFTSLKKQKASREIMKRVFESKDITLKEMVKELKLTQYKKKEEPISEGILSDQSIKINKAHLIQQYINNSNSIEDEVIESQKQFQKKVIFLPPKHPQISKINSAGIGVSELASHGVSELASHGVGEVASQGVRVGVGVSEVSSQGVDVNLNVARRILKDKERVLDGLEEEFVPETKQVYYIDNNEMQSVKEFMYRVHKYEQFKRYEQKRAMLERKKEQIEEVQRMLLFQSVKAAKETAMASVRKFIVKRKIHINDEQISEWVSKISIKPIETNQRMTFRETNRQIISFQLRGSDEEKQFFKIQKEIDKALNRINRPVKFEHQFQIYLNHKAAKFQNYQPSLLSTALINRIPSKYLVDIPPPTFFQQKPQSLMKITSNLSLRLIKDTEDNRINNIPEETEDFEPIQ